MKTTKRLWCFYYPEKGEWIGSDRPFHGLADNQQFAYVLAPMRKVRKSKRR